MRTKPEANQWLYLTTRVAALGADAFEQGPVMIRKIHAYLVKEVNLFENAEEKAAEFVNRVCQVTLETFWTEKVKGEEGYPEQMRESVRKFYVKKATDSWNKLRDLRHTLIQCLLHQNRFGTGEDETIEREEDVRRHVGGMPLLTDLSLAMRTDPLALIRGATEFVTVIYGPAVTIAFPDVKVEAYRRSVLHLNLISAVDGNVLNWCEQHVLREFMSEDLLFGKIAEPEMTVVNFDDHFRDRMGEVEREHI